MLTVPLSTDFIKAGFTFLELRVSPSLKDGFSSFGETLSPKAEL